MSILETKTYSPETLAQWQTKAHSYQAYAALGRELLAENRTSPADQGPASEKMLHYTRLNLQRMERWDKTFRFSEQELQALGQIKQKLYFVLLSELWCGDAAQNVPILAQFVQALPQAELLILFRDLELELMDEHLTNGGRSIPKMLIINEQGQVIQTWGPRPQAAQDLVMAYKAQPQGRSFEEFAEELHAWYAKNRGQALKTELFDLAQKLQA